MGTMHSDCRQKVLLGGESFYEAVCGQHDPYRSPSPVGPADCKLPSEAFNAMIAMAGPLGRNRIPINQPAYRPGSVLFTSPIKRWRFERTKGKGQMTWISLAVGAACGVLAAAIAVAIVKDRKENKSRYSIVFVVTLVVLLAVAREFVTPKLEASYAAST